VPIHHYYVGANDEESSPPLRVTSSKPARIEFYLIDGPALAVDDQGNGTLQDPDDQLFVESDGKGHLHLPLAEGSAGFQLRVYPEDPLPEEGLRINIQLFENDAWEDLAQNVIYP
jgi:hypothetical protein